MDFPQDYATARQRFRDTAARLGWSCQPHGIGSAGPDGEDLTIDVATSPPARTDRVLVVSSGLHGVEGPLGSAVQIELMNRWAHNSVGRTAVRSVFIHALNPFGYAWSRRSDSDGIDPNRNFLSGTETYAGRSAIYPRFDRLLNPRHPPSRWDLFYVRGAAALAMHGAPALKQALVTGQHDFPRGLFFGGSGPSRTHQVLAEHMRSWIGDARTVAHLDFHTGLGRWGTYRLLLDYPLSAAQRDRLVGWFGSGSLEEGDPHGVAYRAQGSFGRWCATRGFAPDYLFVFAECGTYGGVAVIAGLRAENQAHHWGRPGDPSTVRAQKRLRELFCPASPAWRARALTSGMDIVERAVNGLIETDRAGRTR